jgi:hypothetical protein
MDEVAIHCMQWRHTDSAVHFPTHSGSSRAFALAMTRWKGMECAVRLQHDFVIARRERSERRGNPSCPGGGGRVCLLAYWFTVYRHGLSARAMTRCVGYQTPVEETFGVLHSTHLLHRLIPQRGFAKPNHLLTTRDQDAFQI